MQIQWNFIFIPGFENGQRSEEPTHFLRWQVPQAYRAQGIAVQEGQGIHARPRTSPLRSQTARIRRSDEADLPKESQDHQEDRLAYGVQRVQTQETTRFEALQALRVGRPKEDQGTNDPILDREWRLFVLECSFGG